jgi:hypothetical protein
MGQQSRAGEVEGQAMPGCFPVEKNELMSIGI